MRCQRSVSYPCGEIILDVGGRARPEHAAVPRNTCRVLIVSNLLTIAEYVERIGWGADDFVRSIGSCLPANLESGRRAKQNLEHGVDVESLCVDRASCVYGRKRCMDALSAVMWWVGGRMTSLCVMTGVTVDS